jgi:P-type Ca2+ transporter type 2C
MSDRDSTNLLASTETGEEANKEDEPPLSNWHTIPSQKVEQHLNTDRENGLSTSEVEKRLQQYGPNALTSTPRRSALSILVAQFKSLIVVLLIIAASLAFLLNETIEGFRYPGCHRS